VGQKAWRTLARKGPCWPDPPPLATKQEVIAVFAFFRDVYLAGRLVLVFFPSTWRAAASWRISAGWRRHRRRERHRQALRSRQTLGPDLAPLFLAMMIAVPCILAHRQAAPRGLAILAFFGQVEGNKAVISSVASGSTRIAASCLEMLPAEQVGLMSPKSRSGEKAPQATRCSTREDFPGPLKCFDADGVLCGQLFQGVWWSGSKVGKRSFVHRECALSVVFSAACWKLAGLRMKAVQVAIAA